ncbi:MAG: hypothetical protein GC186_16530 [Rhodobacteraceae bacterium]|nr:hypothetical protein [Paracoccaceae bacterium]
MSDARAIGAVLLMGGAGVLGLLWWRQRRRLGLPMTAPSTAVDFIGQAKAAALAPPVAAPAAASNPLASLLPTLVAGLGTLFGAVTGAAASGATSTSPAAPASGATADPFGLSLGTLMSQPSANSAQPTNIGLQLKSDLMTTFGLTSAQAAGVVGNLSYESGGFNTLQEVSPLSGQGGYGYAQWTGSRRTAFLAYCAANNLAPSSYAANWGFLSQELQTTQAYVLPKLQAQTTADGATTVFEDYYERPAAPAASLSARVNIANQYAGA